MKNKSMDDILCNCFTVDQLDEIKANIPLIGKRIVTIRDEYMCSGGAYGGADTCSVDASLVLFFEDGDRLLIFGGRDCFYLGLNEETNLEEYLEESAEECEKVFGPFCYGRVILNLSMDTLQKVFRIHLDSGDILEFGQDYDECHVSVLGPDYRVRNLPFNKFWYLETDERRYIPLKKMEFYLLLRLGQGEKMAEYEIKGEEGQVFIRHAQHFLRDEEAWIALDVDYGSFRSSFVSVIDKNTWSDDFGFSMDQYYYCLWYRLPGDTSHRHASGLVCSEVQYLTLKEYLTPIMGDVGIIS